MPPGLGHQHALSTCGSPWALLTAACRARLASASPLVHFFGFASSGSSAPALLRRRRAAAVCQRLLRRRAVCCAVAAASAASVASRCALAACSAAPSACCTKFLACDCRHCADAATCCACSASVTSRLASALLCLGCHCPSPFAFDMLRSRHTKRGANRRRLIPHGRRGRGMIGRRVNRHSDRWRAREQWLLPTSCILIIDVFVAGQRNPSGL